MERQFPVILSNVIHACKVSGAKLVFFDNTYMYPQNGEVLTESTLFAPIGRKGRVRKEMAEMVLAEITKGELEAVICRAPEFYGPRKTQSITNTLLFNKIKANKRLKVPLSDTKRRSLIWTPDASRATALIGNTPSAYGQTWHLPVDNPATYKELIKLTENIYKKDFTYGVIPKILFKIGAIFNKDVRELLELLPRYEHDNLSSDSKFRDYFPNFKVTSFTEGIKLIKNEHLKN